MSNNDRRRRDWTTVRPYDRRIEDINKVRPGAKPERRAQANRREVSEATFGTGSELTAEEIERAEKMRFCSACGIYHEGRACSRQE